MSVCDLPKVELHLHLEGAAPAAFIRGLASEKNMDLSGIFAEDGGYAYRDFDHFLKVYDAACTVLTGPEDFRQLVVAVMEELAAQGVIYAEAFICPDFCGGGDLPAWREYLAAMQEAEASVPGVTLKGVVTCVRHLGPEKAKTAAMCAAETYGDFVVGLGMGGAEMMFRPADFAYSFDLAREAGMPLTCHAGEWGGPAMVAETLRDLKVQRIGHGINAIDDAALVDKLVEDGIVLEVCPGSNVFLKAVPSWQAHPIERLRERGVKVTVSTDDPPYFRTTMKDEYEMLERTFGWDEAAFVQANGVAVDAAFCDEATKTKLREALAHG